MNEEDKFKFTSTVIQLINDLATIRIKNTRFKIINALKQFIEQEQTSNDDDFVIDAVDEFKSNNNTHQNLDLLTNETSALHAKLVESEHKLAVFQGLRTCKNRIQEIQSIMEIEECTAGEDDSILLKERHEITSCMKTFMNNWTQLKGLEEKKRAAARLFDFIITKWDLILKDNAFKNQFIPTVRCKLFEFISVEPQWNLPYEWYAKLFPDEQNLTDYLSRRNIFMAEDHTL